MACLNILAQVLTTMNVQKIMSNIL